MNRPYTFDRVVRMLIGIAVLIILILLTKRLSSVLLPFLVSWLLAYLIYPLVRLLQYKLKLKNRIVSVIVALLLVAGVLTGIVALLAPRVGSEISKLNELVSLYMSGINADTFIPVAWQDEIRAKIGELDWATLLQNPETISVLKTIAPKLWSIVGSSLSVLAGLTVMAICLMYLVFILIDYEKMATGWAKVIPGKYRPLLVGIVQDLESGMNRYFRGQALVASIVGVLFAIGFSITGLPLAIVIGLFIGLLNLVPYLQIVGIIPCLLLGLLQSAETGTSYWLILLGIAIVFVVVQCIQDMILVPKIMGNITGLNPAIILLALSVWGSLLGMVGMIIALPLTTVMISYYKRFVLHEGSDTVTKL